MNISGAEVEHDPEKEHDVSEKKGLTFHQFQQLLNTFVSTIQYIGTKFLFLKPLSGGPEKKNNNNNFWVKIFQGSPKGGIMEPDHPGRCANGWLEPQNHLMEKEHERNQTIMTSGSSR